MVTEKEDAIKIETKFYKRRLELKFTLNVNKVNTGILPVNPIYMHICIHTYIHAYIDVHSCNSRSICG